MIQERAERREAFLETQRIKKEELKAEKEKEKVRLDSWHELMEWSRARVESTVCRCVQADIQARLQESKERRMEEEAKRMER